MSFQVNSVPFTVKTGDNGDLTDVQLKKFADNFKLPMKSGTRTAGHVAVWTADDKLEDGGAIPDLADVVLKKPDDATELAVFTITGDLIGAGLTVNDLVTSSDLTPLQKTYHSLTEIGVTSMDSTNWVANATAIVAALQTLGGGSLDIPYLFSSVSGSAVSNLIASIVATTGTGAGKCPFSPSTGRLVLNYIASSTQEATFTIFKENRMAICSQKFPAPGLNGVWYEVSVISTAVTGTEIKPKLVATIKNVGGGNIQISYLGGTETIAGGQPAEYGEKYAFTVWPVLNSCLKVQYRATPGGSWADVDFFSGQVCVLTTGMNNENGYFFTLVPTMQHKDINNIPIKGLLALTSGNQAQYQYPVFSIGTGYWTVGLIIY